METIQQEATMPMDLMLIRHGRSKANEAQQADKNGEDMTPHLDVYDKHDFEQRLASTGIKQAQKARRWMLANDVDPEEFDARFVSPYYRTLETAAHLGGTALWVPDARLVERDWGSYGAMTIKERQERYPETERMRELSSFFTRFDGGESVYDVYCRFRDFLGTLSREMKDKRVLAVTHGELMWAARFTIERMMPHEWEALDRDKTKRISNCAILWYTRTNPEDPEDVRASLSDGWRRMIDPIQPSKSPYDGEWQKLPGKQHYNGEQLLQIVDSERVVTPS